MILSFADKPLPPVLESIRQRIGEGGSLGGVLLAFGAIAAIFIVAYALTRGQARLAKREWKDDPRALFGDLMNALCLDREDQARLRRLAARDRLIHPSVLLISATAFDRAVTRGASGHGADPTESEHLARLRNLLFPRR